LVLLVFGPKALYQTALEKSTDSGRIGIHKHKLKAMPFKRGEASIAAKAELEQIKKDRSEFRKEPSVIAKAKLRLEVAPFFDGDVEGGNEKNKDKTRLDSLRGIIEFYLSLPEKPTMELYDDALDDLSDILVKEEGGVKEKIYQELDEIAKEAKIDKWLEKEVKTAFDKWAPKVSGEYQVIIREAYGQVEIMDDVETQVKRFEEMLGKAVDDEIFVTKQVKKFELALIKEFRSDERLWKVVESEMSDRDQMELRRAFDEPTPLGFISGAEELKPLLKHGASTEVQRSWGMLVINRLIRDFVKMPKIEDSKSRFRTSLSNEWDHLTKEQAYRRQLYIKGGENEGEEEMLKVEEKVKRIKKEYMSCGVYFDGAEDFFNSDMGETEERIKGLVDEYAVLSGVDFNNVWDKFIENIVNAKKRTYKYNYLLSYPWTSKMSDRRNSA
jgi:hypothetical protein